MSTGLTNTHTARGFSALYHVFDRKQCVLCSTLRHKNYLTLLYKIADVKIGFWLVETSSLYLHKARSTRHACIIVQHTHASYVTLSAKHRNLYFRLSAIMAEGLPCFGFQFLNVEKDEKSDCHLDKFSTKKTMEGLYTWVNKREINFWQTQRRKPQKVQQLGL